MTTIRVKENEPFDVALRRFKRTIEKIGLLTELRARPLQARAQHAAAQEAVLTGGQPPPCSPRGMPRRASFIGYPGEAST